MIPKAVVVSLFFISLVCISSIIPAAETYKDEEFGVEVIVNEPEPTTIYKNETFGVEVIVSEEEPLSTYKNATFGCEVEVLPEDTWSNWSGWFDIERVEIPLVPDITCCILENISTVSLNTTDNSILYNITISNTGNVNFSYVLINATKFNLTCVSVEENSFSTNFTGSVTNYTCYRLFNLTTGLDVNDTVSFNFSHQFNTTDILSYDALAVSINVTTDTTANCQDYVVIELGEAPVPIEIQLANNIILFIVIILILVLIAAVITYIEKHS
jgi:hypothetical protein